MRYWYAKEAAFSLEAVRIAARLCRRIQSDMVTGALSKSDRSPVTVADFASQAVVSHMLQETFPSDPLVAEEDSAALQRPDQVETLEAVTSFVASIEEGITPETVCEWIDYGASPPADRFWTLDPIDGTKGFLRGDQYVVALALIEEGQVLLGALGCPNLNPDLVPDVGGEGSVVIAVRGQGAWACPLDGSRFHRLQVSYQDQPEQARILRSFESAHTDSAKIDMLTAKLGTGHPPVLMDSQAKFAVLAVGGGELLFRLISPHQPNYVESIWDQAAGSLIVEEAGGQVSDLRGRPLDFGRGKKLTDNVGVLVSNGRLHEAALEAIRAVGAEQRPEAV
jgi:3'(2'), 5'-bisphosphate nucleotidase